ncbi:MAG: thioredoxin domain-containing protein [Chlamydiota bacterium]
MKKRVGFLVFIVTSCNMLFSLPNPEPAHLRNQDIKIILQKTLLSESGKPLLNMMAAEAISLSQKTIDAEDLIQKFRASFEEETTLAKFCEPYSIFTDAEIRELRKIHENPVYEKFSRQGVQTFQTIFQNSKDALKDLADNNGVNKKTNDLASSLLEITQDNFHREIEESTKPLIIDVYSTSCPPCRLIEPIFEELSHEYQDTIRFVKLNWQTQNELARRYGVTHLPTLLFIKPGEKTASLKTVGFTSKKELQAKITEFLAAEE